MSEISKQDTAELWRKAKTDLAEAQEFARKAAPSAHSVYSRMCCGLADRSICWALVTIASLQEAMEQAEIELADYQLAGIPAVTHSDEAWRRRVAELEAKLEQAEQDSRRLDWLQYTYAAYPGEVLDVLTSCGIRKRIDAAMRAEEPR